MFPVLCLGDRWAWAVFEVARVHCRQSCGNSRLCVKPVCSSSATASIHIPPFASNHIYEMTKLFQIFLYIAEQCDDTLLHQPIRRGVTVLPTVAGAFHARISLVSSDFSFKRLLYILRNSIRVIRELSGLYLVHPG